MITIFCSPKPFIGNDAKNQLNALRSWRGIDPSIEIIVFGDSLGAREASLEVNAKFISDIESSDSGAPSFNSMVNYTNQIGQFNIQLYINSDILLDQSIIEALQLAHNQFSSYLLVGERMDLASNVVVDTQNTNWLKNLQKSAENGELTLHGPTGADYFGFIRGMWENLPPVFMGRAMCDQALIHYALKRKIPVVDATLAVKSFHQYHGYTHIVGGRKAVFNGADREVMARYHNLNHSLPTIADSNWRFEDDGGIQINRLRRTFLRRVEQWLRYNCGLVRLSLIMRGLQYFLNFQKKLPHQYARVKILKSWKLL